WFFAVYTFDTVCCAVIGGPDAFRSITSTRVHRATRRRGGMAARGRSMTPAEGALGAPMPDKGDFGSSEMHETGRGGERVLIRRARPDDVALYPDCLRDVGPEDLRLRFFARVAELSAAEVDKIAHPDYRHEMAFVALDEDTGRLLGLVRLK